MGSTEVSYRVDCENKLVAVDGGWDAFALESEAPSARSECVLGRPILDFVAGDETRHLHEVLLARARAGASMRALPFRCDSPGLRRYMEMDIASPDGREVEYRCRVVRTESRTPVPVAGEAKPDERVMRMCSWCKKVHLTGRIWVEVEEAIARFGLLEDESPPPITHGMCESCLDNLTGAGK